MPFWPSPLSLSRAASARVARWRTGRRARATACPCSSSPARCTPDSRRASGAPASALAPLSSENAASWTANAPSRRSASQARSPGLATSRRGCGAAGRVRCRGGCGGRRRRAVAGVGVRCVGDAASAVGGVGRRGRARRPSDVPRRRRIGASARAHSLGVGRGRVARSAVGVARALRRGASPAALRRRRAVRLQCAVAPLRVASAPARRRRVLSRRIVQAIDELAVVDRRNLTATSSPSGRGSLSSSIGTMTAAASASTIAPTSRRRARRRSSSTLTSSDEVRPMRSLPRHGGQRGRDGEEGSEDHDSISLARFGPRCAKAPRDVGARARSRVGARRAATSASRERRAVAPRGPGSVATNQRSMRVAHRVDHAARCPCRRACRTPRACADGSPCRRASSASARAACGLCATSSTIVGPPGQHLEAARQRRRRRGPRARAPASSGSRSREQLERSERRRGVGELVAAAQRRHAAGRSARRAGPAIAPLRGLRRRSRSRGRAAAAARRPPRRARAATRGGSRSPQHRRAARRGRCRPSRADRFARVAEEIQVVEVDLVTTATSASTMLTASSRPPSPTSSTSASSARAREQPQRRERAELEVRERRRGSPRARASTASNAAHQRGVARLARRRCARARCSAQVRRGVEADAIAGRAQDRLEERAGRALAVGAADDDRPDTSSAAPSRACTARTRSRPSAIAFGCSVSRYASQSASVSGFTDAGVDARCRASARARAGA